MPIDRPPSILRRLGAAAAMTLTVATALLAATGTAAAAPPVRVSNADIAPVCPAPSRTGFCTELSGGGAAAVVDDRRGDSGGGYLRLTTRAAADHATVFAQRFGGLRLTDLNDLAYATFVERSAIGNDQAAPSITIPIRLNRAASFTTLVWEPTYSGTRVTPNRWQRWTPSTAGGGWRVIGPRNRFGFPGNATTFAQVKAAFPDAVVSAVGVNQGSGAAGVVAGVDQLRVNGTTYDFENADPTADLGVAVTAPPATPGSTVNATITVTNAGRSPARDISTSLFVSGGARVVRAPGGVTFGQITAFRAPLLGVGASVTYVVTLSVDKAPRGPLTLFAGTHSAVPDPRTANNSARATVPVWAPRPLPVTQPGAGPLPGPYPAPQPGPRPGPLPGPQPGPRPGPPPAGGAAGAPAPVAAPLPAPQAAPAPAPAPQPASIPAPVAAPQPAPGPAPIAPPQPAPGPVSGPAPQAAPQQASAPAAAAQLNQAPATQLGLLQAPAPASAPGLAAAPAADRRGAPAAAAGHVTS